MNLKFLKCVSVLLLALSAALPTAALAAENSDTKYGLGETLNAGGGDSYAESNAIESGEVHFGWQLGQFSMTGFTRATSEDGTPVFLKNVGDELALWFDLYQDIDSLNGDDSLSISDDDKASDQRLGVAEQDFGRGTLIIRYTDSDHIAEEPKVYTDFLSAKVSTGANTRVEFFEEGDYEVALDYEVKDSRLVVPFVNLDVLPGITHYTIRFSFKVRNGNCMVYPFDIETGDELTDKAFTEGGFKLDLAKSRYLDIDVKKEILAEGGSGLTEDTRFNRPAKDGEEFTDEGIYTFTVSNRYTGRQTTKTIYVGTDPALKAYVTTGKSLDEIQSLLANGSTVAEDGTIVSPAGHTVAEVEPQDDGEDEGDTTDAVVDDAAAEIEETSPAEDAAASDSNTDSTDKEGSGFPVVPIALAIAVALAAAVALVFKARGTSNGKED